MTTAVSTEIEVSRTEHWPEVFEVLNINRVPLGLGVWGDDHAVEFYFDHHAAGWWNGEAHFVRQRRTGLSFPIQPCMLHQGDRLTVIFEKVRFLD